jgi:hypothetical protein
MTNTSSNNGQCRIAREPKTEAVSAHESAGAHTSAMQEKASATTPKEPNKTAKVLSLLKRSEGAMLVELVEATGWLPHTTRAALTGLKKKGHRIERTKVEGVSRYSLVETAVQ